MNTTNTATNTATAQSDKSKSDEALVFALVQTNFLAGDIQGNAKKARTAALEAKARGANVIIFPELALMGHGADDLLLRPNLGGRIKQALALLSESDELKDTILIIGYPHVDHHGRFNSAAIITDGAQKGFYHKQLLPNHGVFDEKRYFHQGNNQVLFDYKGVSIGLLIGHDIWVDNCVKNIAEAGADVVVCINASPFELDRHNERKTLLAKHAQTHQIAIAYVNTVDAQDDIVFDGGSMVVQKDGTIAHEASRFLSQTLIARFDCATHRFDEQARPALQLSEESEMYQALVVGLRDYVNRSGFKGVIVGLSGGIDSALTLCIATDALGADKVFAVMMPYKYTAEISLMDAEAQAARLNVSYTVCPIHDAVAGIRSSLAPLFANGHSNDSTEENIQARARGTILMALSNRFGHMVLNTSNKSECAVGYGTLYGDMVGGFGVLKDIYKTDVYRLAHYRNRLEDEPVIPERVIVRPPSAELRPEQKDQDSLPDYDVLDGILRLYIEGNQSLSQIVKAGFDEAIVRQVLGMVNNNEYKRRQAPLGTKISRQCFGRERRYPLVNGWQLKLD